MIRIAEPKDLATCQNLLQQIGMRRNVAQEALYLNDTTNGFTILVERDAKVIAISTFTIRKNNQQNKQFSSLYWENLIVDKFSRDGVAYLAIIGYVRKLLRRGEFDEIYLVARRKMALEAHKAARFKTFGYFSLIIHNVVINRKAVQKSGYSCLGYHDFLTKFHTDGSGSSNALRRYRGFELTSNIEIQRWLAGKEGQVIIDDLDKRLFFLRSLIKNKFFEVNLFIPSSDTADIPNLSEFNTAVITVTLRITRHYKSLRKVAWYMPRLIYEGLCLNEKKSLDNFEIWEHDAW